ncbi:YeeE/YedE family protein [Alkalicaulis satelles]|uniref:YeeE/YedE family protein n=1 Tax=Alkalicaulis satelles TaxID=2609175 RepID=A0A5M6ZJM5_9PROT|nr:YeeE/YedE family protein [Alkalicaulis satelles]KAA5803887.1 YeeE/YedE family protein [Alkalicaulis satelles]
MTDTQTARPAASLPAPLAALGAGLLFGLGLVISGMINPAKVLNFLDVAGSWDPSLAFVMGGALAVTAIGYRLVLPRGKPLFAERFALPAARQLDPRLIGGAALFGIGWGLAGFCPGPALSAAALGMAEVYIFLAAMLAGMAGWRWIVK